MSFWKGFGFPYLSWKITWSGMIRNHHWFTDKPSRYQSFVGRRYKSHLRRNPKQSSWKGSWRIVLSFICFLLKIILIKTYSNDLNLRHSMKNLRLVEIVFTHPNTFAKDHCMLCLCLIPGEVVKRKMHLSGFFYTSTYSHIWRYIMCTLELEVGWQLGDTVGRGQDPSL